MNSVVTVSDALVLLERSAIPTVLTEGSDDYRIMRKVESQLSDLGVDFLPIGNKNTVLEIWSNLPASRRSSVIAIVDLDLWILSDIPNIYQKSSLLTTFGFSIENDIFLDGTLLELCEPDEKERFFKDLSIISSWYARQITFALNGDPFCFSDHVNSVIASGDIKDQLNDNEKTMREIVYKNYPQVLRGKAVLQLLMRQLSAPGRYAKFGYKQLYEIGSSRPGEIFSELESKIRNILSQTSHITITSSPTTAPNISQ